MRMIQIPDIDLLTDEQEKELLDFFYDRVEYKIYDDGEN